MEKNEKDCRRFCPSFEDCRKPLFRIVSSGIGTVPEPVSCGLTLALLMKGKLAVNTPFDERFTVNSDEMFFIPSPHYNLRFVEEGFLLLLFRCQEISLCSHIFIALANTVSDSAANSPVLKIKHSICSTAKQFVYDTEQGLMCRIHQISVIAEIFAIIFNFYSREELTRFFAPTFEDDSLFKIRIMQHKNLIFRAEKMARELNLGIDTFRKRFKLVFNTLPSEWIKEERKKLIYKELCTTERPLREIAALAGFRSEQIFSRFCKTEFGKTPEQSCR
jgi:AraC-like DNA-binding protein